MREFLFSEGLPANVAMRLLSLGSSKVMCLSSVKYELRGLNFNCRDVESVVEHLTPGPSRFSSRTKRGGPDSEARCALRLVQEPYVMDQIQKRVVL